MKSYLSAALLAGALVFGAQAQAETLRFATEGAYPPFNFIDSNNQPQGFDVDIAYALCEKMNVTCEIVLQDWDGIIPGLLSGRYDAVIASMTDTEERREVVDFTDRYYSTRLAVAVPKDSDITSMDYAAFAGKTLGSQSGTAQAMYAEDNLAPAGATVRVYPTTVESFTDMQNGRLDALIHDIFPLMDWLENDGKDCCKFLGEFEDSKDPISIAIRQGDDDLKQRLNQAIQDIRADGTYQEINNKYFSQDIY